VSRGKAVIKRAEKTEITRQKDTAHVGDRQAIYSPLDSSKHQIRLLEITPSDVEDSPIVCRLHVVSLDEDPKYTALSYVWGEGPRKDEIIVNGAILQIMPNLASALQKVRSILLPGQHPRYLRQPGRFWADAICIYLDLYRTKHLRNLRCKLQFFEGFVLRVWLEVLPRVKVPCSLL
jgi:hypothetical protein